MSFLISPRLAIYSAVKQCGKTTLLDIISYLALRAVSAANVSTASVFRVVEMYRPTLLIDEADTFLARNDDLRGVLNSGHRRNGGVIRTVGDDHVPRQFSTYSACAIALIGKLPDTLHDRSAPVIELKRRLPSERIESFRLDRTADLEELARKAVRWAADNAKRIERADPELPTQLFNRDADNWRPLIAIADLAGGEWPQRARLAAVACCGAEGVEDASLVELLLRDVRDLFAAKGEDYYTKADEIRSKDLVDRLCEIEGHPWAEMGDPPTMLTPNRLAKLLGRLSIGPGMIGPEEKRARGYQLDQFKDAFDRYLRAASGFETVPGVQP